MKMKRAWALAAAIVLSMSLALGTTLAYLTDTDKAVNVMTLGNVDIEQIEEQLAADGTTEAFEQNKPFYPGMEISKIVSVENTGKSDAYFRTLIAFEDIESDTFAINFPINDQDYTWSWGAPAATIVVDGTTYVVYEALYKGILPAGETSPASLTKVEMAATANNEDMEALGGHYEILVLSQAVQTAGFTTAEEALNAGFGIVNDANAALWFAGMVPVNYVYTAEELQQAIDNAADSQSIFVGANITGSVTVTQKPGVVLTIDGGNFTFDGTITVDGKSARYADAGVTIKNIKFVGATADACIRLGISKNNDTRYTSNVTVENCVFNAEGKVGVKSYTGGDKNLVIKGCTTNDKAHSLVQVANIEGNGIVVEDCVINSKNGMNFNSTAKVVIKSVTADVQGYAARFGADSAANGAAESYRIENSTLKSAVAESGDAVVILRGTADKATLKIVNSTLVGEPAISNPAEATIVYSDVENFPADVDNAEDLKDAVAVPGSIVNLTANITADTTVPANGDAAINLNDNTLEGSFTNRGKVEINNGTMEQDGYGIENFGDATISNVDMNVGNPEHYGVISNTGSTTVLNDVDLTSGGGGVAAANGAEVTFNSGKVFIDSASTSGRYVFYSVGAGSKLTINGGEFGWDSGDNQKRAYIYAEEGTTVYVNGGTFGKASTRSGYTDGILGTGTVIIKGGTFGFNPTKWVAEGYEAVQNGTTWTVQAK